MPSVLLFARRSGSSAAPGCRLLRCQQLCASEDGRCRRSEDQRTVGPSSLSQLILAVCARGAPAASHLLTQTFLTLHYISAAAEQVGRLHVTNCVLSGFSVLCTGLPRVLARAASRLQISAGLCPGVALLVVPSSAHQLLTLCWLMSSPPVVWGCLKLLFSRFLTVKLEKLVLPTSCSRFVHEVTVLSVFTCFPEPTFS